MLTTSPSGMSEATEGSTRKSSRTSPQVASSKSHVSEALTTSSVAGSAMTKAGAKAGRTSANSNATGAFIGFVTSWGARRDALPGVVVPGATVLPPPPARPVDCARSQACRPRSSGGSLRAARAKATMVTPLEISSMASNTPSSTALDCRKLPKTMTPSATDSTPDSSATQK